MTDYITKWCEEYGINVTWRYEDLGTTLGTTAIWSGQSSYNEVRIHSKLKDFFTEEETQWHEFSHCLAWQKDHARGHGDVWRSYRNRMYGPIAATFLRLISSIRVLLP